MSPSRIQEITDRAKNLFAYEAYKMSNQALEIAEEAEKFSRMTDSDIMALLERKDQFTQKIIGKWININGHITNTFEFKSDGEFSYSAVGQKDNGGSGKWSISEDAEDTEDTLVIRMSSAYGPDSNNVPLYKNQKKSVKFEDNGIFINGRFFTRA